MSSNFRILAKNIAEARNGASISASPSMVATLPESNLLLATERARTARTTSTASQLITVSWAASKKCNAIAISRHNLTTAGTMRSVLSDVTPSTLVDTGALAAFSTSGLDTDIDTYTDADFLLLKNTIQYVTLQTALRSLACTFADVANPAGYMEINRLHAGKYFELTYNPGGLELTVTDASVSARADDGSHIVDKRWKARTIVVNLEAIPDATDLATMLAIARYLGKDGECFIDAYPDETGAKGIYGRGAFRLVDSPTFNPYQFGVHKNSMKFEET